MFLFSVLLFVSASRATQQVCQCSDGSTFTREQAWICAMNVVDTNGDHKLDGPEIEAAKYTYLSWFERTVGWIAGPTKLSAIMKDCDNDGDNVITIADFEAKKKYCMPYTDPFKPGDVPIDALCHVKDLCDRAAKSLGRATY